jgi:hypothetical protein
LEITNAPVLGFAHLPSSVKSRAWRAGKLSAAFGCTKAAREDLGRQLRPLGKRDGPGLSHPAAHGAHPQDAADPDAAPHDDIVVLALSAAITVGRMVSWSAGGTITHDSAAQAGTQIINRLWHQAALPYSVSWSRKHHGRSVNHRRPRYAVEDRPSDQEQDCGEAWSCARPNDSPSSLVDAGRIEKSAQSTPAPKRQSSLRGGRLRVIEFFRQKR